jgi:type 2 lantibiotic biosynthesis protein LanM
MEPSPRLVRSAFLPELLQRLPAAPAAPSADGEAQAREWQQSSRLDEAGFAARLRAEGLTMESLARIFSEREGVAGDTPWYLDLRATFRAALRRPAPDTEEQPFAATLYRVAAVACAELRAAAAEIPGLPVDWGALGPALERELGRLLVRQCQRTLVLELHVARLEERLQGDTPEARYTDYTRRLLADPDEWDKLFDEYQVLARLLWTSIGRWKAALLDLLTRLAADWPELRATFFPDLGPARLVDLAGELSDPHREGRSVRVLRLLADGDDTPRRLVYKPKSLAVDLHFQDLLRFCNAGGERGLLNLDGLRESSSPRVRGPFPAYRTLRLLARDGYGWVEFAEHRECDDADGLVRFYVRQGGYLALLHLLDGADMHFENVIACGEHPVLVDLEMLFHPMLPEPGDPARAETRAQELLRDSVIRTGLLPGRFWGEDGVVGLNVGGLGSDEDQFTPREVFGWAGAGTDEMRVSTRRVLMAAKENLPRMGGAIAPVGAYTEELIAGFEAMLRFLAEAKPTLLADHGPLAAFAGDEVRRLVRPTSSYGELIGAGHHPDHLRDALDREQLLDMLWAASGGSQALLRLTPAEKEDLRLDDIPYFTGRTDSRDIWDSRGARIAGILDEPPLAGVRARLRRLDDRELRTQVALIRAALSAAAYKQVPALGEDRAAGAGAPLPAHSPLAAAQAIAAEIESAAIHGERDATWLATRDSGEGAFNVLPTGPDLYDGTAGIALFFAHLAAITGEPRQRALAERAAQATLAAAATASPADGPLGGFFGVTSQLYALAHLRALWDAPELLPPLAPRLDAIADAVARTTVTDIVYGLAGGLLGLLSVFAATGEPRALEVARACGRRLRELAIVDERGAAWACHVNPRPLLGFSHGVSGIGYALTRLAEVLLTHGDDREAASLSALASDAFRYERSFYDPEARNWPDLREDIFSPTPRQGPRYLLAWCHGAPGVALSRLSALTLADDGEARGEVEAAIEGTFAAPLRVGQSLCHGEVGNLMIAAHAARALQRPDWQATIAARLDRVLTDLRTRGLQGDFTYAPSAPGLMTGIAGIAYGLLQLAHPDRVPQVLALAPPAARTGPA